MKIGLRIKQLREKAKMSQKDLSFASNLDRSYIASVESGKRNISIVNIENWISPRLMDKKLSQYLM